MNRHVVAGMLGLALAGCAQDRSVASRPPSTVGPVELTPPMASIHETINQENSKVDTDSVRAGHPLAASPEAARPTRIAAVDPRTRPKAKAATPVPAAGDLVDIEKPTGSSASTTATTTAATEPVAATEGRPAPFAGVQGQLRPRSIEEAQTVAEPAPSAAAVAAAVISENRETPSDPSQLLPGPIEATTPAASVSAVVAAETQAPAEPLQPAGRVKYQGNDGAVGLTGASETAPPIATETVATPETAVAPNPAPPGGTDPLLGPNPDVMPAPAGQPFPGGSPRLMRTTEPARAPEAVLPAPEIPTTLPEVNAPPTSAEPAPAPEPAATPTPIEPLTGAAASSVPEAPPVVQLSPPTEIAAPPAAPAASAPVAAASSGDPLLGPNPEVMPRFEVPTGVSVNPAQAQGAPIPAGDGKPPSVSEMVGLAPPGGASTAVVVPQPAASALSSPSPAPAATPAPAPPPNPEPASASPAPAPVTSLPAAIDLQKLAAAPAPAPVPSASRPDPLLGPDPDVMPDFKLPAAAPAPAATPEPTARPTPTPAPVPAPAPAPVTSPRPTAPVAAPKPEKPESDAVELPPVPGPAAWNASPRSRPSWGRGFASVPVSAPTEKTIDPAVQPAAANPKAAPVQSAPGSDPSAVRSERTIRSMFIGGTPYAWVGDEVITHHDVTVAVKQRLKGSGARASQIPPAMQKQLIRQVLGDMIDRSLVIQEARRDLKDPKKYQQFMGMADKIFFEEEVPPLLRQNNVGDVNELKKKLSERGESLDDLREQFRLEFLSRGYMEQKLGAKMKVELREMREYYMAHLHDFDLPAQVTWREVLVEVHKHKSRAEARARADSLLLRLRRGDDFATLAKAESDGPNKEVGGLWKTSPGSYGVPAVNAALETLPTRQVSPVIEGPTSYHIVLVEHRRQAGPATFAEVLDKVRLAVRRQKVHRETGQYIDKLRRRTVVRTLFDNDPDVTQTSAVMPSTRP